MDIESLNITAKSCADEVRALAALKNELNEKAYNECIYDLLQKFVSNPDAIEGIMKYNTFSWEISVLLEMRGNEKFINAVEFYNKAIKTAFARNQDGVVALFNDLYPSFNESLKNWHDCFYLQLNATSRNPRHRIRSRFRMLGDAMESSMRRQVNVLYQLIRCDSKGYLSGSFEKTSFGNMISELSKAEEIKPLYIIEPGGLGMSQWRNIAQHSSYSYDEKWKRIDCEYGSHKKKILSITEDELENIIGEIFTVHKVHKIALDFFHVDMIFTHNQRQEGAGMMSEVCSSELEITVETIFSELFHQLTLGGYSISSVRDSCGVSVFELEDTYNRGLKYFKTAMREVSRSMFMAQEKGYALAIELYSKDREKLTEMRLEQG